jgi:hypothetical protein
MIHFVFLEHIQSDPYLDLVILGATEFLAALFSKVIFKTLRRRNSLLVTFVPIILSFFFLSIFRYNIQTRYVVTITTRASLQIFYNVLIISTLEQFPTEIRAFGLNFCLSAGLAAGMGLPFIKELGTELIILIILIYLTASVGIFFLRETKHEQ